MAEILIKAVDANHGDPDKEKRGCYKRGDPVVVMADGHEWGKEERLPKFVVVKIPGLSVEQAKKFIKPERGILNMITGEEPVLRRRLYKFKLDEFPGAIRVPLQRDGEVTVTMTQIKNYIQNKDTLVIG